MAETRHITQQVQDILRDGDAAAATALAAQYNNNTEWLAEALCLFNTAGLVDAQKKQMLAAIFPQAMDDMALADICARTGRYGFSFPQWRFLTQSFDGKSLMEHYGFTRLMRETDVRTATLPPRDPARDEFGVGFIKRAGDFLLEYRRAYILCANMTAGQGAALLIRNSSYFFGRDRLPQPVYAGFGDCTVDELLALTLESFNGTGYFQPLQNAAPDNVARLQTLLDVMDAEDMALSRWLEGAGQPQLKTFLAHTAPFTPVYRAYIDPRLPPWFPQNTKGGKFVLLSGPHGDLAVAGDKKQAISAA